MKATFENHIGFFENAFSKEYCESVIDLFEKNKEDMSFNRDDQNPDALKMNDTSINIFDLYKYGPNKESREKAYQILEYTKKIIEQVIYPSYFKKYPSAPSKYKINSYKIQKTLPSEGYHVWHGENDPWFSEVADRFAAYTLYLNDVEEGGETEFLYQSKRLHPKAGSFCIFPSNYTHVHRGNPPISNKKYIMTGWINLLSEDDFFDPIPKYPTTDESYLLNK